MDDVQERALSAFAAALADVEGVRCYRNPEFDMVPAEMPALAMVDGGDDVEPADTGSIYTDIRVTVGVYVAAGGGGAALGPQLRLWRRRILDRITPAAGGSATLGGAVVEVRYDGSADPADIVAGDTYLYTVWPLNFRLRVMEPL
jgi:hypothetical protein